MGAASKVVAPEVTRLLKEAKALLKKKAPAQALQLANKALDTLPGHGPAMLLSAEARTLLKQFGLAVTVLKSCSEVQPSFAPCLYELGRAYERMGNRGAATKAFNDVVTRFPGSTSAIEATRRLGK